MRVSKQIYEQLINHSIDSKQIKQNKYKNKKVEYHGNKFDSKKEGAYYLKLKTMEELGIIRDLKLQVKFELQPSFKFNGKTIRAINYIADFTYYDENNRYLIVDTKGVKTEIYKIKKKMMQYKGYEIEEV